MSLTEMTIQSKIKLKPVESKEPPLAYAQGTTTRDAKDLIFNLDVTYRNSEKEVPFHRITRKYLPPVLSELVTREKIRNPAELMTDLMYKIITDIQTGELFMPGRLEFGILIDELPKAMNLVEKKGRITGLAEEVGKWWKARGEFFKRIYDKLYCKRFRERHGPNSCCSHYNLGPWEIYKDGSSFKEDQAAIEIKNEEIRKRRKKDKTKEPLEESLIDYASRIIAQNEDEPKKEPEIVERVTSTGSLT